MHTPSKNEDIRLWRRTLTIGRRITVWLVSTLTRKELTKKKVCYYLYGGKLLNSNCITGDQRYSDPSSYGECSLDCYSDTILNMFDCCFQCSAALHGGHLRGPGSTASLPHRDVHLLHRLLHRLPILLRQHLRGADHHHVPGARRSRTTGWGN